MKLLRAIGRKIANYCEALNRARMERDILYRDAIHRWHLGR